MTVFRDHSCSTWSTILGDDNCTSYLLYKRSGPNEGIFQKKSNGDQRNSKELIKFIFRQHILFTLRIEAKGLEELR